MTAIGNRHSTILMYADADPFSWSGLCSHRVRIVLSEKDVTAEVVPVVAGEPNEELLQLNSSGVCPTLVDRDLVLYDVRVIIDYLDERYPHSPLLPIDPISRARTRLALYRIETDWYTLLPNSPHQTLSEDVALQELTESLVTANEVFAARPFFLGEEYSILDATLAPLLWQLRAYGILLPEPASAVTQYADRMFARPGFLASLSDADRDIV